jgi:hypothetical protein
MFESAKLKIGRAKQHIRDLDRDVRAFFDEGAYSLSFVKDAKAGTCFFRVNVHQPIPPYFALIIGDAIHNLRSALDQMVWEIVCPFNPNPEKVQFPFCEKADRLESVIRNREIHLAGEKIIQAVRDAKPYPCDNGELFLLHKLDIADKHKIIIGVTPLVSPDRFKMPGIDPYSDLGVRMGQVSIVPGDDGKIGETPYTSRIPRRDRRRVKGLNQALRAKHEHVVGAGFHVSFAAGQPFGGQAVITVMVRLVGIVEKIVADFSAATGR